MRSLSMLAWALLAAACAPFAIHRIEPGTTRADEVRARLGAPGMVWKDADGGETWEYSGQPAGGFCWMVSIAPDGRVVRIDDALRPDNLARVAYGMDRDEVRRLLGRPRVVQHYPGRAEEVWDWRLPQEIDMLVFFNVHFGPDGRVVRTSRTLESPGASARGE